MLIKTFPWGHHTPSPKAVQHNWFALFQSQDCCQVNREKFALNIISSAYEWTRMCHGIETLSTLLIICEGYLPVTRASNGDDLVFVGLNIFIYTQSGSNLHNQW